MSGEAANDWTNEDKQQDTNNSLKSEERPRFSESSVPERSERDSSVERPGRSDDRRGDRFGGDRPPRRDFSDRRGDDFSRDDRNPRDRSFDRPADRDFRKRPYDDDRRDYGGRRDYDMQRRDDRYSRDERYHRDRFDNREGSRPRYYEDDRRGPRYEFDRFDRRPRDDYREKRPKQREDPTIPNETIGIFNLSYSLVTRDFDEYFTDKLSEFKDKFTTKLIVDRFTGKCKGYGFLTFDNLDDSIKAKSILENGEIMGQAYRVAFSVQRRNNNQNAGREVEKNNEETKANDAVEKEQTESPENN